MAVQRIPQDEPEPERPELRLVHSTATAAEAQAPRFARGLMWGLIFSIGGFWAPVMALLWRWLR